MEKHEERLEALREKVIGKAAVYDGVMLHVERWEALLPNGKTAAREVILHPGAAAIVPVDAKGNVTLVRQHRVAVDRVTYELPAGKRDAAQEDPLLCAKRELEEETGLTAAHWQELGCMMTTPAFCTERIWLYLATGLTQAQQHLDEDEFVGVEVMPLSKAVEMVMRGEICDGKTMTGLLMAERALQDK